jgi:hypothetical protein
MDDKLSVGESVVFLARNCRINILQPFFFCFTFYINIKFTENGGIEKYAQLL